MNTKHIFFQAEDGIRDIGVTGVQTCALPIYFLPYLFLFGAMFRLQREPAGPEVIRVPGGKPTALLLSCVGFGVTSLTIALSLVPGPEEANPVIAIFKVAGGTVALVAVGAFLYWLGKKRACLATLDV